MVQEEDYSSCARCSDSCYGNVVNASGKYFHQYCFTCHNCSTDLIDIGYFSIDEEVYCKNDYQSKFGKKCTSCNKYIEDEFIAIGDSLMHPQCFGCIDCGKLFPVGTTIVFCGVGYCCEDCDSKSVSQANTSNINLDIQDEGKPMEESQSIDPIYNEKSTHPGLVDAAKIVTVHPENLYELEPTKDIDSIDPIDNKYLAHNPYVHEKDVNNKDDLLNRTEKEDDHAVKNIEMPAMSESVSATVKVQQVNTNTNDSSFNVCAGCDTPIKSGQALLALDKQWHLWCFTCNKCGTLLVGEYMGRDGVPYCEEDYQSEFGVTCAGCGGYITGKVLQAGEKHYHPHCSRCAKCGKMFGEGEEMYLQGSEIWHPQCSEDFRRESIEALDQLDDVEDEKRLPPSYESTVEAMHLRRDSRSSSNMSATEFRHKDKNFMNNHEHQFSDDSLGGQANHFNSSHHSSIDDHHSPRNSSDDRIIPTNNSVPSNIRKLSNPIQPRPKSAIDFPSSQRMNNPPGFRSVKPPQFISKSKPDINNDDDDAPPPVPPPPRRSSSNSWKDKYVSTGVYTAKPFEKYDYKEHERRRPLSFVESAARRASMDSLDATDSKPTTNGRVHKDSTDSNPEETPYEPGISSYSAKSSRVKGVGYNKLQLRKMQQQQQQNPIRTSSNASESSYRSDSLKRGDKLDYLTEDEFFEVFNMSRDHFYAMPKWKQEQAKKQKPL